MMYENTKTDSKTQLPTGAIRCANTAAGATARYDLLPPTPLRRWAEAFGEGAAKYGEDNWLKGFDARNLMNHLEAHIQMYKSGDHSEDHLAHAMWNLGALMHFEETRPDLMNLPNYQEAAKRRINESRGMADV